MADADIETFAVPGAFELPQAAHRVATSARFHAIVCLGCLIRGETAHFDFIAQAVAYGITRAGQDTSVPITFGVLTTNTAEEALARAGEGSANKGREAALAARDLVAVWRRLEGSVEAGASGAGS
jgi:6,7-dimethyl-8-ribityllumazine synthase